MISTLRLRQKYLNPRKFQLQILGESHLNNSRRCVLKGKEYTGKRAIIILDTVYNYNKFKFALVRDTLVFTEDQKGDIILPILSDMRIVSSTNIDLNADSDFLEVSSRKGSQYVLL